MEEELRGDLTAGEAECLMSHSATAAGFRSVRSGSCCECFRSVGRRTSCRLATSDAVVAEADDSFRRPLLSRGRSLGRCCCCCWDWEWPDRLGCSSDRLLPPPPLCNGRWLLAVGTLAAWSAFGPAADECRCSLLPLLLLLLGICKVAPLVQLPPLLCTATSLLASHYCAH